ncbi:MAG: restriction endonuclease subunit S [Halanaerobiales bacterium]|nr:restriction endonuclease subunit S [Halanaerobiales bacterium]
MKQEIKERIDMINRGEVPEGYKKTNGGIIPDEWEYVSLKTIIKLISGQHINEIDYNTSGEGIPYLTGPSDFEEGYIKANKYTNKPKTMCNIGDILITVKGSGTGKTTISDNKYCISRQLMAIRAKPRMQKYIYFYLKKNESKYNSDSAGLIPGITRNDINNSKIMISQNINEIYEIGNILSTWASAIELKEKLIEQKKEQKKGLLQNLLTGKIRTPKFEKGNSKQVKERLKLIKNGIVPKGYRKTKVGIIPKKWEEKKSKNIFENYCYKKHNGELEVLSVTQDRGVIPRRELDIDIKYNTNNLKNYKKVEKGNFIISLRSFEGGIEYSNCSGLVSPAYTVLRKKTDISEDFYKYLFKQQNFINRLNSLIYGIRDGKQIGYKDFKELNLQYPCLEEQKAIGKILLSQDEELCLLEQELTTLKQQKKGLMQLLLTGKVRVTV